MPDNQDKAFPLALQLFAPSGLKGIILAGFFAAVMASVSSLSNSIATIFSLDVYKKYINKDAGDKKLIVAGQISGGAALIASSLIAPLVGSVGLFKYFQTGVTYMATPFISVLLMGLFWRRANYAGAVAGLIGGVIIQVALGAFLLAANVTLHWLYVGAIAQALTMLLIVVVSLRTTPPVLAEIDRFLWKWSWVQNMDDKAARRPWWKQIKLWFALYALAWCYIYWRFW